MIYGTTKVQTTSFRRPCRGKDFLFLSGFMSFGAKTTQPESCNFDMLACIRDIFQEINKHNASMS